MKLFKILLLLFSVTYSYAQTNVIVRAKAKDAKFIGSSIGGAQVIIRNVATGEILASGETEGSTGNTERIMKTPHERYKVLSDASAAKFETTLDISEPTFVEVGVVAPQNKKQAAITASTQLWVIPGEHITGDGIVIEIPGFIVDILAPQTHESMAGSTVTITSNVVMMCGCPLSSGGLWDADKIKVHAIVTKDGSTVKNVPLNITEKVNTFSATLDDLEPGLYEVTVYAFDDRTSNSGVDKVNFMVR